MSVERSDLLLVEYEHLKKEQHERIKIRDHLFIAMMTAGATTVAATVDAPGRAGLLLLLPPIAMVLGWTYLTNDQKITALGGYIRNHIAPALSTAVGGFPVFAWETEHRGDSRRRARKAMQLAVDLMAFCVIPLVALAVFLMSGTKLPGLWLVSLMESAAIALLATQIVIYSDRGQ